ncbi:MAG: glycoside hydrolase family 2 TIM barrel-domain containing protein [Bacillota bacterium]|nr:glycoside hydrolase family 2 TIM barrel-domain containing protein [Bacillota bacterium]
MRRLTLNGLWDFRIDPDLTGENLGFSDCSVRFDEQMMVPGSWRLSEQYRHYHGVAWYKRLFDLDPADISKQVGIWFGGAFRHADIFINGQFIKQHKGFQSGFGVDVTSAIHVGENCLAVRVDDTQARETDIMGGASVMETEYVHMAGLYEPVWLEIREAVYVTNVYAPLDRQAKVVRLSMTLVNTTNGPVDTTITVKFTSVKDSVIAAQKTFVLHQAEESSVSAMEVPISAFELWSPEHPALYDIDISVRAEDAADRYRQRTGFKSFEADGSQFYLNDQPYFLRGYGDDFVFPLTGLPGAEDADFYKPLLLKARDYGFNAARHHSHFPYEAYFTAADEIGILVQPELALANIPMHWFTDRNQDLFLSQWRELLLENRHHPCIMAWCGGNEQEWGFPFEQELYSTAKALDPFRLVMATDGNFMAKEIGSVHDYASIVYAEYTDVLPIDTFSDLYLRDRSGKPQIVHEMGNYCTLPDISELSHYDNAVVYPEQLRRYAVMIRDRALETLYERCFVQAKILQRLCHKLNIEAARRSPYVSGYHLWTFNDYHDTTQGIVSALYRDKAFTASQFAQLNAPSILLWDTPRVIFGAGETICFTLLISKYHQEDWPDARLFLSVSSGQALQLDHSSISAMGLMPLTEWSVTLANFQTARQLVFRAELTAGDVRLVNEWPLWVYPDCPIKNNKEIFINYLSRYLVESCNFRIRHFTIPMPLDERHLIITGFLYDGMLQAVEHGASMLLLADPHTFRHTVHGNAFKSPWWMAKPFFYLNRSNNIQAANVLEDHPALANIPHETCWNLNFYHLVENRYAIRIDSPDLICEPILYGVDADLNRLAYLFEFSMGKGRILVSTLNFDRENMKNVEVRYTFNNLVNYCQSIEFKPKHVLPLDHLINAFCSGDEQT